MYHLAPGRVCPCVQSTYLAASIMPSSCAVPTPETMASILNKNTLTSTLEPNAVDVQSPIADLTTAAAQVPRHSHDPQNNMKRSDPFQFGSRYLQENDDIFEFNAWDHVETDDSYKEYAEIQYAKQRESPVSDFDKSMSISFYLQVHLSCLQRHDDIPKCIVHLMVVRPMNDTNVAMSFAPI